MLVVGFAISAAMHWPLLGRLSAVLPGDLVDPALQAWQVAWGGHALVHQPLQYFEANAFWPLRNSLAFSDALIGYAPLGVVGSGVSAAVVRYNLLFLLASALAFAGAYLLARQLGCGRAGAAIAGLAFAYSPWRLSQVNHLHVLSSGGIPLALFFLLRGHRERVPLLVMAGWLTAAWQVSLGFTLGLQLGYLLGGLALLAAVDWLLRGKPRLDRNTVAATAVGILLFAGWATFQAQPYFEVVDAHPEARREETEVEFFSPPKKGLLAAADRSLVWGRATKGMRDGLNWPSEQTLFPGLAVVALATIGLATPSYSVRARAGCALGVVAAGALSFGFHMPGGRFLYGTLYQYAPGWQGLRVPGRLMTLTSLFLALLAGAAAHHLFTQASLRHRTGARWIRGTALVVLPTMVLVEGLGHLPLAEVPPFPEAQRHAAAPQLHLPIGPESLYLLWSTEGFPAIANGYSGFSPRSFAEMHDGVVSFPDRASVELVESLGVRTVVLHPELAGGTPWEDAHLKPVDGLPLKKRESGGIVVYSVGGTTG